MKQKSLHMGWVLVLLASAGVACCAADCSDCGGALNTSSLSISLLSPLLALAVTEPPGFKCSCDEAKSPRSRPSSQRHKMD